MTDPQHDTIEAVSYSPSAPDASRRFRPLRWIGGILLAIAAAVFWFLFTSKSVLIAFTPQADRVDVSGGIAFELGGVYLLRQGDYRLRAETDLHEPLDTTISVGGARNQTIELSFTPLPGTLILTTEPADAQITIDGAAATARSTLSAGTHSVSVSHPRYQTLTQDVDIAGRLTEQSLNVRLAPNWAEVEVSSSPAGAEIWIDGEQTGQTTPAIVQALAGEREIQVKLDGHRTHRQRIFSQAGKPQTLAPITLQQADAMLRVTSSPAGAGVTINGRFVGTTPVEVELKSSQTHRLQVIRKGYETFSQSIKLARGASRDVAASLTRQFGDVVVTTEPAQAQLLVDGQPVGQANQTLRLPVRPHEIEIQLAGHAGYKQQITPRFGLAQEIKVRLLTLEEARLAALKPSITTAGGQNIKLFSPYPFTMGASRREPGRRANETLREVSMSRLFYLSTMEVTNAQFRQFATGHDSGSYDEVSLNEDDQPVVGVSWHDAAAYCNWLSARDNLPAFYDIEFGKVKGVRPQATGYRLPTEAEWEWAARTVGTEAGQEQLRFPWGDNLPPPDRHGNYADRAASSLVGRIIFGYNDNHAVTAPVGTFKADRRGLYDLGGNVAEWTNDFYEIPEQQTATDPTGPASGDFHVIKGSSWMHGTITELRHAFRDYGIDGRQDLGFRIARYAE